MTSPTATPDPSSDPAGAPLPGAPGGATHNAPTASRRKFLTAAGLTVGAAGAMGVLGGTLGGVVGPGSMMQSVAAAQTPRRGAGQLVVVFLRGGTDGLSVVVPAGDPGYYANRPGIAVPAEAALPLDSMFGLHPAMAPLYGLWQDRRLAVVQAVGNIARSRSHFDAQDLLEQGSVTRRSDGAGWLTRHLATTASDAPHSGLFRGVAISSNTPGSLRGSAALSIPSLASFGLGGASGAAKGWNHTLRMAYSGFTPAETTGQATVSAIAATNGITKPPQGAGAFADAAALLASDLGVEVVTIDVGGWDTHNAMGTHSSGDMRNLVAGLATNLARLQADLDARGLTGVTTVVMSEFGRRVVENASGGTDHGAANMMLIMGGRAAGGVVHGIWPGLAPSQLDRGDVAITTDVRDVLWEIVRDVLGNPSPGTVFDAHTPTPVGVTA
jgi:uncharacterized protein (DUF1501 family)